MLVCWLNTKLDDSLSLKCSGSMRKQFSVSNIGVCSSMSFEKIGSLLVFVQLGF